MTNRLTDLLGLACFLALIIGALWCLRECTTSAHGAIVPCVIDGTPCIQRRECTECTACTAQDDKCCCRHVDRCLCSITRAGVTTQCCDKE